MRTIMALEAQVTQRWLSLHRPVCAVQVQVNSIALSSFIETNLVWNLVLYLTKLHPSSVSLFILHFPGSFLFFGSLGREGA
jgi:hypothetical protein